MDKVFDSLHGIWVSPPKIECLKLLADQNVFHEGTSAFYDTLFSGMVPCKITEIKEEAVGYMACSNKVTFVVTKDRGPYKKGEILTVPASQVPPRKMIRRRGCYNIVTTTYKYSPKTPAELVEKS